MRDVRGLGGISLAVAVAACQPQPGGVTARLTLGWEDLAGSPPAQADIAAVERRFSLQALAACDGVIAVLKPGVAAPAGARRIGERTWALRAASASEATAWLARLERHPGVELAEPDVQVQATSWPPNDPLHRQQWSLPAIQVPALWALTRGKEAPLVAVIDSGVDATHPDLAGRIVKGRDFIDQDDEPNDPLGHGTFVAGVVAAAANNGQGMAGIAPEAKVLAVRVLDDTGRGRGSSVIEGVRYAASAGAKVLNLSLGSFYPSSAMRVAIAEAQQQGCLVVAAGGNTGDATATYPAGYAGVIGVGAVDAQGARCSWSTKGSTIRLAAPGLDIPSCLAGGWHVESGTSVAAPHVSAVAAALWGLVPQATAAELDKALTTSGPAVTGFPYAWVRGLDAAAAHRALAEAVRRRTTPSPAPTETTRPDQFSWSGAGAKGTSVWAEWGTFVPRDGRLEVTAGSPSFTRDVLAASHAEPSLHHRLTLDGLAPATTYRWRVSFLDERGLRVHGAVGTLVTGAGPAGASPTPSPRPSAPMPAPTRPPATPKPTPRPTPTATPGPTAGGLPLTDLLVLPTGPGLVVAFNTAVATTARVEISRRPDFSLLLRTENRKDPATRHVMLITGLPNHTPLWLRMTGTSGSRAGTPQVVGPLTLTP